MKNKIPFISVLPLSLLLFGLAFSVFAADYMNRKFREIELAKPSYLKRTNSQWEKNGRIIGEVKNTPKSFSIDICTPGGKTAKVLKTEIFSDNLTVYETGWLGAGTYDIVYKAEGYMDMAARNVIIKPYSDCVINVIFGLTEYKR
jgi:hypothetical protein